MSERQRKILKSCILYFTRCVFMICNGKNGAESDTSVNCHVRMPTVLWNHSFDTVYVAIYTFDSLANGCTRMFSALLFPPLFSPVVGSIIRTARCLVPNATLFEYSLIFREDNCNCLETVVPNLSYFATEPSIQVEHALNFGIRETNIA